MDATEVDFDTPAVVELTAENWCTELLTYPLTLVAFGAPWCSYCRRLDSVLKELAITYNGRVMIAKLNTDKYPSVARAYRVRGLPQLVLINNSNEVDRMSPGYHSILPITKLINNYLIPMKNTENITDSSSPEDYQLQAEILTELDALISRGGWFGPNKRQRALLNAVRQVVAYDMDVVSKIRKNVTVRDLTESTLTDSIYKDGVKLLKTRLGEVGLDPLVISAIIAAIMMLFDVCPLFTIQPRNIRNLPRRRLAIKIKRELDCDWEEAMDYADKVMVIANQSTDKELESLIYDCCS